MFVESIYDARRKPWDGIGAPVYGAATSKEAIKLAKLDWTIEGKPIYDENCEEIKGFKANTRSSDNNVLGIVSDKYKVVQNQEAFDFTDSLIGNGLIYETAGSLRGGKTIWLLGKMPERYIAGDEFEPYICFTNNHDGTGAVRCCMTPVRVICQNTLNLALQTATRSWSAIHRGNISMKLEDARQTLRLANKYLVSLDEEADRLANQSMSDGEIHDALDKLFPLDENATDRQKRTVQEAKDQIIICTVAPDLQQFLNTKWGFINAISDYVGHGEPARKTQNWRENRWGNIIGGHELLDRAMSLVR